MKNLEQCTFSQEQEAESLQISFWDIDQSLQSNGTDTPVMSSELESQMDGLMECQCGKETFNCSIHPSTKAEWIAYMQDSLARILAKQEISEVLAKTQGLDFTEKSYALQTHYNLDTCSWRTSQQSLAETTEECLEPLLETLPNEATMRCGVVYPLPKLVLTTNEIGGGAWPTPRASDVEGGGSTGRNLRKEFVLQDKQQGCEVWRETQRRSELSEHKDVAYPDGARESSRLSEQEQWQKRISEVSDNGSDRRYGRERQSYWAIEPAVGRVVDGMADRTHRIKALGNGQVPLQAATAFKVLWQQHQMIRGENNGKSEINSTR